jgi:hypothetical protein
MTNSDRSARSSVVSFACCCPADPCVSTPAARRLELGQSGSNVVIRLPPRLIPAQVRDEDPVEIRILGLLETRHNAPKAEPTLVLTRHVTSAPPPEVELL